MYYIYKTIYLYKMLYIIYYETELFNQYIDFLLDFCSNKKEEDIICVVKSKNDLHEKIHRYYYSYRCG